MKRIRTSQLSIKPHLFKIVNIFRRPTKIHIKQLSNKQKVLTLQFRFKQTHPLDLLQHQKSLVLVQKRTGIRKTPSEMG